MSTGVFAFKRKFFTSKSISLVSELLFVYLIPLYGVIEITRIGTIEILNLFWILIVNFVIQLGLSYGISVSCHYIFKLDERIRESFNLVCTIPAMGALPLVIGKAFCFPGGPIEGDPYCDSMIGLMMLCYFVVCLAVFLLGFLGIFLDKSRNDELTEKMIYLWHDLIDKLFKKDYTILYLFTKYLKDQKKANELFEAFEKEHREDMKKVAYDERARKEEEEFKEKRMSQKPRTQKHNEGDVVIEEVKGLDDYEPGGPRLDLHDSYFDNQSEVSEASEGKINNNFIERKEGRANTFIERNKAKMDNFVMMFERRESFYPGHDIKSKFETEKKKEKRDVFFNKSGKHFEVDIEFDVPLKERKKKRANTFLLKNTNFDLHASERFQKNKLNLSIQSKEKGSKKDKGSVNDLELNKLSSKVPSIMLNQEKKSLIPGTELKTNHEIITNYYQCAFDMIESDPENFKLELVNEYEEMKKEILHKVNHNPPKFPIVRCVNIDRHAVSVIEEEWKIFEPKLRSMSQSFKGLPSTGIRMDLFLTKVFSPPTLSVLLGLILSLSSIRELIFNEKNHYFLNIVDGLNTLDKTMVPFLFLLIGLSAASTNGLSMNVPLKKKHIIIAFILRFLVIPALGLLAIYVWKECYGGVVKDSFAFRIIMFFPWCLPSAPNMAVIVNLTQYFFEEYGYLILLQNIACVVTLTILYMIYFILVGL